MICHLCSGHFLSHPFLYFCSEVLRSFLGHEYNAVTIGRLFPLGQHLCLIVVVLVGANAATLLVVCILKLFNAGRPTWLCAGTYDYYFFLYSSQCLYMTVWPAFCHYPCFQGKLLTH